AFAVGLWWLGPLYHKLGYPQKAVAVLQQAAAAFEALLRQPDDSIKAEAERDLNSVRSLLQQLEQQQP
ncbi:MAG: hypothetical protein ACKPJD_25355, partial [Planctomycetaceae bacterium]